MMITKPICFIANNIPEGIEYLQRKFEGQIDQIRFPYRLIRLKNGIEYIVISPGFDVRAYEFDSVELHPNYHSLETECRARIR